MKGDLAAPFSVSPTVPSSSTPFSLIPITLILLSAPPTNMDDPHPKRLQVFIATLVMPPHLMSHLDIPPFPKLVDMPNTLVVFFVIFSSSSFPLTLSMGISHTLMKHKLEDDPASNGGWKKGLPSSEVGSMLACTILVIEVVLVSPKFVTAPESFDEVNNGSWVPPSSLA